MLNNIKPKSKTLLKNSLLGIKFGEGVGEYC